MIVGHENLIKHFKNLAERSALSHGYLFFGESRVGKTTVASALANFLENGRFENPDGPLADFLSVSPDENGVIGIDAARMIKEFLWRRPFKSTKRFVSVSDASAMTSQAQNALLKISEEPPAHALIVIISPNAELLAPTLVSRLQKFYFSRISDAQIVGLAKSLGCDAKTAEQTAKKAAGRPGLAVNLIAGDPLWLEAESLAKDFLKIAARRPLIASRLAEDEKLLDRFAEILLIYLRQNAVANLELTRSFLNRFSLIKQFNVNKRLQLEAAAAGKGF
ncbi:MAG: hypothetical protein HZA37_02205 [Parcubacteria group bacterium]|nr:hypothetical protein [Parcubacteria group bacterium]